MEQLANETANNPKSPLMSEEKFESIKHYLLHPEEKKSLSMAHWVAHPCDVLTELRCEFESRWIVIGSEIMSFSINSYLAWFGAHVKL